MGFVNDSFSGFHRFEQIRVDSIVRPRNWVRQRIASSMSRNFSYLERIDEFSPRNTVMGTSGVTWPRPETGSEFPFHAMKDA